MKWTFPIYIFSWSWGRRPLHGSFDSVLLCLGACHIAILTLCQCQGKKNFFIVNVIYLIQSSFQVVQEYERAVVFRLGRLRSGGAKGPGLFFIMPCVDTYKKVDLRTVSFDVPPQEVNAPCTQSASLHWKRPFPPFPFQVLSRDSVTVSVDAVVYYRVSNPTMATNNIEDYR